MTARLNEVIPQEPGGSLRLFGEWFGGRRDNYHVLTRVEAIGTQLLLLFDGGEALEIDDPDGLTVSEERLRIDRASRVLLRWQEYGSDKGRVHELEYVRKGDRIFVRDTSDWYDPAHRPDERAAAVEIS
jgi:hypothetical protein